MSNIQVNIPVFPWKLGVECWLLDIQHYYVFRIIRVIRVIRGDLLSYLNPDTLNPPCLVVVVNF